MKTSTHYARTTSFAIIMIFQTALLSLLGVLMYVLLTSAARALDKTMQAYLVKLAYLTGAALVLTAMIFVGTVLHHLSTRLLDPLEPPKKTPYESAWTEAGKRLKNAPPVEPYEKPDEP